MRSLCLSVCLLGLVAATGACRGETPPAPPSTQAQPAPPAAKQPLVPRPPVEKVDATPEAVAKARKDLGELAEIRRKMRGCLTFDEFEKTVYKEPFEGGKYIIDGDTTIASRKLLREYFEKQVKPQNVARLAIMNISGLDAKWNQQLKTELKYCVSNTFGPQKADVVQQMAAATGDWEKVAAVHYVYDSSQDATCLPTNTAVVFDVRPVNVGDYLARAFFPNEPRESRNVLIDQSSFDLPANETLKLVGILRHELGHTLGFRHEHTRPESGTCFEDSNWRPLTNYDAFSVMHYPQCNGRGDWSLALTDRDKSGSACVYGPASGFKIDPSLLGQGVTCAATPVAPTGGTPQTESVTGQTVAKDAQKAYGPYDVVPGSQLDVSIGGAGATGDPDLYVRFGSAPNVNSYDCRPYLDGAVESCSLTVPNNAKSVFVMVRGYAQGSYDLKVTHVSAVAALKKKT